MGQLSKDEVFALAVQRYSDTVFRAAMHNCSCTADAEDVVQDVFEKLLNYSGRFESEEHLKAWLLRVIADAAKVPCFEEILFRCTTTIGLRKYPVERTVMEREPVEVKLPFGTVRAKRCSFGGIVRSYPEYESVKLAAEAAGLPFLEVWRAAEKALGGTAPSGA